MIKLILLTFLALLLFTFCNRGTPDFYTTEHGLKYKYHDINSDEKSPNRGDYLTVYMHWKTTKDSIFYDSKKASPIGVDIIKLGKPKQLGGIEEGFLKLQKGDCVSFYISPKRFYKDYLNRSILPSFLNNQEEMIITMRLLEIESPKEYKQNIEDKKEALELSELKAMSTLVQEWKKNNDSIIEVNGSYLLLEKTKVNDTTRFKYGDVIKLDYEASFVNNVVFYSTYKNGKPDEFQIGKDAQLVDGLRYAISKMYYNQKAKILVPSFQGFGSKGSVGNIIPPFTPIIYNINILPKE